MTTTEIIENILKQNHLARSDDKALLLAYWESQGLTLDYYQRAAFMKMKMPESVRRIRQKIQEKGLYRPEPKAYEKRQYRGEVIRSEIARRDASGTEELFEEKDDYIWF